MSMVTPEPVEVICPECGKNNEILWFPPYYQKYQKKGTTGKGEIKIDSRREKVSGKCKKCDYSFKPDDLD